MKTARVCMPSVNGKKIKKMRELYLLLMPAFVLTLLFSYLPLVGWYMAFSQYQPGKSIFFAPFVGLRQFKIFLVESTDYLYVFQNTLCINFLSLLLVLGLSFVFAILLREIASSRLRRFIQTVTFIPYFISWIIAFSLVYALFSPQSGIVNLMLMRLGVIDQGINVMGDKAYAWALIVGLNVWNKLGYNSVIFIAASAGIPAEEYEAAAIDGANRLHQALYVTIPNLMPTLVMLMVINVGWILNSNFEQFYLFTNPSNWEKMEVFDMYIYKFGFQLMNYSYATAVSIMRTVMSILLVLFINRFSKAVMGSSVI